MRGHGGFEHNLHGLRIVDQLEYRYPDFPGLNLSREVRESMAMHSKSADHPTIKEFTQEGQPLLEAQVVDSADSFAYDTHDLDDALWAGLIPLAAVQEVPLWREAEAHIRQRHPAIAPEQFQPAMIRTLIDWQVRDLIENTSQVIARRRIRSIKDVRGQPDWLVVQSAEATAKRKELEQFLHRRVYRHYRVLRMANKGSRLLKALFGEFCRAPGQLPERYARRTATGNLEQTVCDYLAGMTDRFAQDEYLRLFQPFTRV